MLAEIKVTLASLLITTQTANATKNVKFVFQFFFLFVLSVIVRVSIFFEALSHAV